MDCLGIKRSDLDGPIKTGWRWRTSKAQELTVMEMSTNHLLCTVRLLLNSRGGFNICSSPNSTVALDYAPTSHFVGDLYPKDYLRNAVIYCCRELLIRDLDEHQSRLFAEMLALFPEEIEEPEVETLEISYPRTNAPSVVIKQPPPPPLRIVDDNPCPNVREYIQDCIQRNYYKVRDGMGL